MLDKKAATNQMINTSNTTINTLIDAADQLLGELPSDVAWERATHVSQKMGFSAINVVEIDQATCDVFWFRSTMKTQWLSDYFDQRFMDIDPLIIGASDGHSVMHMLDGRIAGIDLNTQQHADYADQISAWDYRALETRIFDGRGTGRLKGVTVAQGHSDKEFAPGNALISAMIAMTVGAPETPNSPGTFVYPEPLLSAREIDVLCYLAAGLRNDAIAWKLAIAEVTVRAHVTSARQKLGAATREEAIAIAVRDRLLPL